MNLRHFDKTTLEPAAIVGIVEHGNRMRAESRPDDPPVPPAELIAQLGHIPAMLELHMWSVDDDGQVVASAQVQMMDMDTNRHVAQLEISVEPHVRRNGIGTRLLREAVAQVQAAGRSLLIASSSDRVSAGQPFLERYGFTPGLAHHVNQLVLADLERDLLTQWLEDAATRASGYELVTLHGAYADAWLEPVAKLMDVMNTAPRGDLDVEDFHMTPELLKQSDRLMQARNATRAVTFARERATETLVGYSELTWSLNRPGIASQQGTGVHPDHRGHGLGRALKAANLKALLDQNPEARFVRTGNADNNAPMLAINHALGFKPYSAVTEWQAQLDAVTARLEG
jgi:GNAT superfamily N-acetyltransferase